MGYTNRFWIARFSAPEFTMVSDIFFQDHHLIFDDLNGHDIPKAAFFENFEGLSRDVITNLVWRGFQFLLAYEKQRPKSKSDLYDAPSYLAFVTDEDSAIDYGGLLTVL
jgi:hypothetical protein